MSLDVKIGINPIGWSNDDLPSLGGETPLETTLKEGAAIGYQGFELGNKFPKNGVDLKNKLNEYGVVCVSGWYSANLARLEDWDLEKEKFACRQDMEKLAYNGCKVMVYGEVGHSVQGAIKTPVSQRPQFVTDKQWQEYAHRVNAFGAFLQQEYDITIAYHHHMGAYVESLQNIDKFMNLTDPKHVGLLFDTGHCWFGQATNSAIKNAQIDVSKTLEKYIDRVIHVHLKDVRLPILTDIRNRNRSFLDAVLAGGFTIPGDGVIDFDRILQILSQHNYKGWLVVEAEQDPKLAPSYAFGKAGFDYVQNLVEKYR